MIKVKKLKKDTLVGKEVPTNLNGHAGRYVEDLLEGDGYGMDRRGAGPDMPGLNVEVKTRDLDATSPQTVGTMTIKAIESTLYPSSSIFAKLQQQLRLKTKDRTIVESQVRDFSDSYIQSTIGQSYEAARQKIIGGNRGNYISGGPYGYFEKCRNTNNSYAWRMSQAMMDNLETMSSNTLAFNSLFEVIK